MVCGIVICRECWEECELERFFEVLRWFEGFRSFDNRCCFGVF